MLRALLFGDSTEQGQGRLVEHLLVHRHVLLGQAPLRVVACLSREACLVQVDDTVSVISSSGQLPLHVDQPLLILLRILLLGRLDPPQLLLLDAVDCIHLLQQRGIHLGLWVFSHEVPAPVDQGQPGLLSQR